MAVIQGMGVAGVLRHESVLGSRAEEAAARQAADQAVAARCRERAAAAACAAVEAASAGDSPQKPTPRARQAMAATQPAVAALPPGTALECLAAWLRLPLGDVAKVLLEMDETGRTTLRQRYAQDVGKGWGLLPALKR